MSMVIHNFLTGRFPRIFDVFFEQYGLQKIFKNYYLKNILQTNQSIPINNIEVDFISGACMFISSKLLNEIGLFEEEFFLTYEETELAVRANKKGYYTIVLKDLFVKHLGQKSFETSDYYISNLKIGQLIYFKKKDIISYLIVKILLISGTILRVIFTKNESKKKLLYSLIRI